MAKKGDKSGQAGVVKAKSKKKKREEI